MSNYKKATKLEEGLTVARKKAELKFKKSSKGLELSLREHVGKAIDRLDPLDTAAVFGVTLIVKNLIDKSEELRGALIPITRGREWTINVFGSAIKGTALFPFSLLLPASEAEKGYEGMFPDWMDWIIAFAIAYVIVKHGGQLLGLMKEGTGTLTTVIGALMGVGVVA